MINLPLNDLWLPLLGFVPIIVAFFNIRKQKKITGHSWFELIVGFLVLFFSINNSFNDKAGKKNQQKEFAAQFQQTRRDIVDSMRNIYQVAAPVLSLGTGDIRTGIKVLEKLPNGYYKIAMTLMSREAASAYFNIKYDFLVQGLDSVYRIMPTPNTILENESVLSKDESVTATHIVMAPNIQILYLWIRGSYKRRDGSGDFKIDDLYGLNPKSDSILLYQGGTKKFVTNFITNLSK